MNTLTIGILGGMGPAATADFFSILVSLDKAPTDQQRLHVIVESDPSIPDRTAHILGKGQDPLPALLASAARLKAAGADLAGIPCMTAHAYLPRLAKMTSLHFISAMEELAAELGRLSTPVSTIGILATEGTKTARLYESQLPGMNVLWPDEGMQVSHVMEAIYGKEGIKAGYIGDRPRKLLAEAAKDLVRRGAEVIIAGCTEVPLVLRQEDLPIPLINPMVLLARALIARARRGPALPEVIRRI